MKADLHMHSVYSDGRLTPKELAFKAKSAGLDLFSVTDHDSLEGLEEKKQAAKEVGLPFLSGWEISAYADTKVHVLGYGCKPGGAYAEFLKKRLESGYLRADDMRKKANAYYGLDVTMDEIEEFHLVKSAPMHTMSTVCAFARRLGCDYGELYLNTFTKGKPAYSDLGRPTPEEGVEIIHGMGGKAFLAHPGRIELGFSEREELFRRLILKGLDGIEYIYTTHTVSETEYFKQFAEKHDLLLSGGSDFHAEDGVHIVGKPDFFPDEKLLEAILPLGGEI